MQPTTDAGARSAAGSVTGSFDPVGEAARSSGAAEETCPSCDAPGAFLPSKRHRFNPFGGVTCLVLAFWAALAGLVLEIGFVPAMALALVGLILVAARRTALVCQVCGFVRSS